MIDKLRTLLADVQLRGTWHARGCYIYRSDDPRDHRQVCRVPGVDPPNHAAHPIAAFIAECRTALPELLDFTERLKHELQHVRETASMLEGVADTDVLRTLDELLNTLEAL